MSVASLVDPFGRSVTYLRLSVTDRCDLRCRYCMSEDMRFLPKKDLLTLEELDRLASLFVSLGVRKIRLTGGEPLVRKGLMTLIERLSRHLSSGALDELTLTTNATQLEGCAEQLYSLGLRRINVSLDTLDESKFLHLTRWGSLARVLRGVEAAKRAGLRIKINTVALKGFNENELYKLVDWCAAEGFDLSFIEVMPMGDLGSLSRSDQYWPLSDLRTRLASRYSLVDSSYNSGGPARYLDVRESGQRLGFITPHTHNFCESCNRVRLTCTGRLYLCLGRENVVDFRTILRCHPQDNRTVIQAIKGAISIKPKGHDFDMKRQIVPPASPRHMSVTGG